MEDQEAGSMLNISGRARAGGLSSVSEEPEEDDLQELMTVKRKFNRLERKSIFTIVKMSRDPR
jgi:hypothetical protein